MASPAPEQLLSNLDPKASQNASIDIVLVAGIGTPECKKWPFDNFEWLAANLPSGIHVLRVLRFEQISWKDKKFSWEAFVKEQGHQLSEKINTACLEDGKNSRPVLYVCHSLGGMLLKKCIDIARHRNGRTDQLFLDTIAAILFISTPHRHPQKTKTHELFREVFEAINGNSIKWEKNAKTDEGKKHDNEVLVKLADRFDDSFPNKKILYTYETTPKPIVHKASCETHLDGGTYVGLHIKHEEINEISNAKEVKEFLADSLKDAHKMVKDNIGKRKSLT